MLHSVVVLSVFYIIEFPCLFVALCFVSFAFVYGVLLIVAGNVLMVVVFAPVDIEGQT